MVKAAVAIRLEVKGMELLAKLQREVVVSSESEA